MDRDWSLEVDLSEVRRFIEIDKRWYCRSAPRLRSAYRVSDERSERRDNDRYTFEYVFVM